MTWPLRDEYAQTLPGLLAPWEPREASAPKLAILNESLAIELGLDPAWLREPAQVAVLAAAAVPEGTHPVAQAYAGHQFGQFAGVLGDGRAVLLGELTDAAGRTVDLSLKGSGRTQFSRGGDGNAVLGPVLRELIISEGMHALGIPTSRALAATLTGDMVYRQGMEPGAVLARIASSHLRIGTFELAARHRDPQVLRTLVDLAIARHHPAAADADLPPLALLEAVVNAQARLIAQWMGAGFIHGVMNTDNMTISGETIDYGPCAFLEAEDPDAVFSSIDRAGRYRFGHQPGIAVWNLSRLAETLLPVIDATPDEAVERATAVVQSFAATYAQAHLAVHRAKLGLGCEPADPDNRDAQLIADYSGLLALHKVDHTRGWRLLSTSLRGDDEARALFTADGMSAYDQWRERWVTRLGNPERDARGVIADEMDHANPMRIPRNHLVEEALTAANLGDFGPTEKLLASVRDPYRRGLEDRFTAPASVAFTRGYVTYCGT